MATQGENYWQSEKTVLECNRYMLDNEIATDVCFEVGPPDGPTAIIRAHKYMLISRSPVFEAMFSSGMVECNGGPDTKIRIVDTTSNTFKDLLLFLYCEQAYVTPESCLPLMYAAKKYMISKLVEICRQRLEDGLNVSNAYILLEQSLVFCEDQLISKCLHIIANHSDQFLSETELLSASPQAMEAILGSNDLKSRESLVYEFCLRWAKHQLVTQQLRQIPTDEQIREMLGGLIYQIRFPIMESAEFANLVGQSNVLSSEEKLSLYYYLNTGNGADQLLFCSQKRNHICVKDEELFVDRAVKCVGGGWQGRKIDAIDFSTNKDVVLTGVGLYSGHNDYVAHIEIIENGKTVHQGTVAVPLTGHPTPYKISFKTPIFIQAGAIYTISVSRPNNDVIAYYAETCHKRCEKEDMVFTFARCSEFNIRKQSQTTEGYGQIPRFYFKKF